MNHRHAEIIRRAKVGEKYASIAATIGLSNSHVSHIARRALGLRNAERARVRKSHRDCVAAATAWAHQLHAASGIDVIVRSRKAPTVALRNALMLALRNNGHSLQAIGKALGGMDHTTILHGVRKAQASPMLSAIASALADDDATALTRALAGRIAS